VLLRRPARSEELDVTTRDTVVVMVASTADTTDVTVASTDVTDVDAPRRPDVLPVVLHASSESSPEFFVEPRLLVSSDVRLASADVTRDTVVVTVASTADTTREDVRSSSSSSVLPRRPARSLRSSPRRPTRLFADARL
jgi:hypothetical protein